MIPFFSFLHGIIPLLTLVVLHFVLALFCKWSGKFSQFVSGKPVIVINPKGIDYKALKNLDISIDDVFESLRGSGYFKIEQVQYAIMETNGKMSVLPKSDFAPLTVKDMKIKVEKSTIPINIINEGKIVKENLKIANIDELTIQNIFKKAGVKKVKDVLLLTIDKAGEVYLQKYYETYQTMTIKPLGEVKE